MKTPDIHPSAFVAPGAVIRGEVHLAENSSVFYNAVLRGDRAPISIGEGTNIQDNCVVHVEYDLPVTVGKNVTVGHGAILHGCTVGDETLIGMGAIVLNGAQIGKSCLIGAGALVTQNAVIPDGCMAVGSPARVKRPLTPEEMDGLRQSAADYRQEAQACKALRRPCKQKESRRHACGFPFAYFCAAAFARSCRISSFSASTPTCTAEVVSSLMS